MSNTVRFVVALQLVALMFPAVVPAQSTHFEALSMPPQEVGSCLPLPAGIVDTTKLRAHKLVMKSIPPGRAREMTAFVDLEGRALTYHEMSHEMTSRLSSTSTTVVATFSSTAMLYGSQTNSTFAYADSILTDPEGFLNGRYKPTTELSRKDLDDSAQRTIRDLIAFLRKRCPA